MKHARPAVPDKVRRSAPQSLPLLPIPPRGVVHAQTFTARVPHGWNVLVEVRELEPPRDAGAGLPGASEETYAVGVAWMELKTSLRERGCDLQALERQWELEQSEP